MLLHFGNWKVTNFEEKLPTLKKSYRKLRNHNKTSLKVPKSDRRSNKTLVFQSWMSNLKTQHILVIEQGIVFFEIDNSGISTKMFCSDRKWFQWPHLWKSNCIVKSSIPSYFHEVHKTLLEKMLFLFRALYQPYFHLQMPSTFMVTSTII